MTGYVRIDTINNIADGNVISAADLDGEFNGVQAAFNSSTGHTHDGTASEGAPITKLGPAQDVTISTTVLGVKTTNTVDLGTSSLKFKDFYLAGNASIGGTLGVTSTATFTGAVIFNGNATIGDADTDTITQAASYVTGTQLKSAKTATNTLSLAAYDVDGTAYTNLITLTASNTPTLALTSTGVGTINNMSIGATTASTGAFTTIGATGATTLATTSVFGGAGTAAGLTALTVGDATNATFRMAFTNGPLIQVATNATVTLAFGAKESSSGAFTQWAALSSTGLAVTGTFSSTLGATIQGLTVGLGAGAVSTNTAVGVSALAANTTGARSVAVGDRALKANTTGERNVAVGSEALGDNTTGSYNTVVGWRAMTTNTTGTYNIAVGDYALLNNTFGGNNTAVGSGSLQTNTTASNNTAVGYQAATSNTGTGITAIGYSVLSFNTTGVYNTAVGGVGGAGGYTTLNVNTIGSYNSAFGMGALGQNTTGSNSTAVGYQAGYSNATGDDLNAFGYQSFATSTAGSNSGFGTRSGRLTTTGTRNSAFGYYSLYTNTTGSYNTAIGDSALYSNTTASNNTAVGYQAAYLNTIGTGNTAIGHQAMYTNSTGINNVAVGGGVPGSQYSALQSNTIGSSNTAVGVAALGQNTTGSQNTAVGYQAGYTNQTGIYNAYFGYMAGKLATGSGNTFVGGGTSGGGNPAGYSATGNNNNFFGAGAGGSMSYGSKNTILGNFNGNQGGLNITISDGYIVLSDGDGNPRGYFDDSGQFNVKNSGATAVCFKGYATSASYAGIVVDAFADRNTTNGSFNAYRYYNVTAGEVRFRVLDSGNVQNINNSYGGTSDLKLKENIVDASPKLEDLCKVKVRNYNFIGSDKKQIGVVAQELEEVFAGMVEETPDQDKDGNGLGTTTKSVKYSVFVPMLIKAIQELKAEVDSLKSQLNQGA